MPTGRCGWTRAPCDPCRGAPAVPRSWAGSPSPTGAATSPTRATCWPSWPARFAPLGLTPVAALEFEFYLVDQAPGEHGQPQVPHSDRLGRRPAETEVFTPERMDDQEAFFELVDRYCEAQELPVKGALCEFAPGQFEINLGHVDDMVLAADQGVMLKRCIKAAARATGQRATFMAKPFAEQSGSGLHIHLSLVDCDGRNLFGETADGERHLRHAIRGLQDLMPETMLVFAPNANSYRRLRPLTYAPTAPSWGWNNRTVALRIPPGGPPARRVEHRVAGSDANPYLVLAAVLAGVLRGLKCREEPSEPIVGNAYAQGLPELPLTWEAAIAAFRDGQQLHRMVRREVLPAVRRLPAGGARPVPYPDHADRVRMVPDYRIGRLDRHSRDAPDRRGPTARGDPDVSGARRARGRRGPRG